MNKTLRLAILLLLTGSVPALAAESNGASPAAGQNQAAAPRPYTYKTPKLNRSQFDALLAKPAKLLVIDVRRPDELSRIGGFPVYLSIQTGDLEKSLAFIPKDRRIVTVSNHAGRAGAAGDLLSGKGFKVAGAVGAQNYEEEGGVLTKIVPPAAATAEAGKP